MTHQLFIVRHAQTRSSQYYKSDKERELKPQGIDEAIVLGKYLSANNYNINLIISSYAERARATAHLIASEINYPIHQIQYSEKIYSGTMNDLLTLIQQTSDAVENLLLVGHYPAIVDLNNYLSDSNKTSMETCELICLNFDSSWSALGEASCILKMNYHPSC